MSETKDQIIARLEGEVIRLESEVAEVCPEYTDIRTHVRRLEGELLIEKNAVAHLAQSTSGLLKRAEIAEAELDAKNRELEILRNSLENYIHIVNGLESELAARDERDRRIRLEEAEWRKLLWLNHARYLPFDHMPYGDDGEMQCCGIDFKRMSAKEVNELLATRSLRAPVPAERAGDAPRKTCICDGIGCDICRPLRENEVICLNCNGRGEIPRYPESALKNPCPDCRGTGRASKQRADAEGR